MSDPAFGAGRRSFSRPSGTTRSAFGIAFGAVAHPDADSDEARIARVGGDLQRVCGWSCLRQRRDSSSRVELLRRLQESHRRLGGGAFDIELSDALPRTRDVIKDWIDRSIVRDKT